MGPLNPVEMSFYKKEAEAALKDPKCALPKLDFAPDVTPEQFVQNVRNMLVEQKKNANGEKLQAINAHIHAFEVLDLNASFGTLQVTASEQRLAQLLKPFKKQKPHPVQIAERMDFIIKELNKFPAKEIAAQIFEKKEGVIASACRELYQLLSQIQELDSKMYPRYLRICEEFGNKLQKAIEAPKPNLADSIQAAKYKRVDDQAFRMLNQIVPGLKIAQDLSPEQYIKTVREQLRAQKEVAEGAKNREQVGKIDQYLNRFDKYDYVERLRAAGTVQVADGKAISEAKQVVLKTVQDIIEGKTITMAAVQGPTMVKISHIEGLNSVLRRCTSPQQLWSIIQYLGDACPYLESFDFSYLTVLEPYHLQALADFPNLRSLNLQADPSKAHAMQPKGLIGDRHIEALQGLPLADLNVAGTTITGGTLDHLSPTMLRLNLSDCSRLQDGGLRHLIHLTHLQALTLRSCYSLTAGGLPHLAAFKKLQYLALASSQGLVAGDLSPLTGLTELLHLDLHNCLWLTGDQFKPIGKLTKLQHLDLSLCHRIGAEGLRCIAALKELRYLDLDSCYSLTDHIVKQLAAALKQLQVLRLLNNDQLTNEAFRSLAALSQLRDVNVSGCSSLTDAGLAAFTALPQLQYLNLAFCDHVTDAGLAPLKARLGQGLVTESGAYLRPRNS